MNTAEIEKSTTHITVEIIEYIADALVIKTILKKSSGNVSLMSFDGVGLPAKSSPFDSFVQIIEGCAEIVIDGKICLLQIGQSIVIPAGQSHYIRPGDRFKMILTIIGGIGE
jgi:mannose-6-phosphate isomerase-like protein (cupin superfamily)